MCSMEDRLQFKLPSMKTTSNHSSIEGQRCHVDLCDLLEPDKGHWVSTLGRLAMVHNVRGHDFARRLTYTLSKVSDFEFNITEHSNKLLLLNVSVC